MTEHMDREWLRSLFAETDRLAPRTNAPLAKIRALTDRRRRTRRLALMSLSGVSAAAAVAVIAVVVHLVGAPAQGGGQAPAGVVTGGVPAPTSRSASPSPSPASSSSAQPPSSGLATPPADVSFHRYTNSRFGFSVEVPNSLTAQTPPANGDGQGFTSRDGLVTLTVYGQNNVVGDTPAKHESDALTAAQTSGETVTHHAVAGSVVVISGTYQDHGVSMVRYERTVIGTGSENTMQWTYPVAQRDTYDPEVAYVAGSFTAGDLTGVH